MPETTKLLRAVVEIGTQLRRLADAQTTPVADDTDTPTTTPDNGRRITSWLPMSPELAAQRAETMTMLERYINGQLCRTPETHNWGCGCPTDTSALRLQLNAAMQDIDEQRRRLVHVHAALAEAQQHYADTDPSERQDCIMCGSDHLADIAAVLGQPASEQQTSPVERDLRRRLESATAELRTLRAGLRAIGGDPTQIQNLWAQIHLRNKQWREAKHERDQLRAQRDQAEELLRVAHDTSNRSEAERASAVRRADEAEVRAAVCREDAEHNATRAETAEQRRDELAATLDDVLRSFVHKGHPGEPCLQTGWIAEKTVARWRAVLYPPAVEEQQLDGPAEERP